ncbi:nacht and ankyrin domain protein [Colletotrichum truncatum]|uniref:Nacht and ankyrin domain protein n=1 Tax=Colletotrichum truncatum TaxID=5467 RepID=A0ACC3YD97_COLTU|nr:nacht and ankyrin domain protein [Colletotrichum truncatum]KAF6784814.1 nacht and ankyrin domain protein [Colletotrichum truncatum]
MERKRKGSNGIPYHESRVPPSKRHELDREAKPKLAHHKYTVGWICAIDTEYVAAQEFLDEEHAHPHNLPPNDGNHYTFGRIGLHNVVMAVLAEYGIASATAAAKNMQHSFPNVEIRLMVGIGGGAPSSKNDIRLGDIVVSAGSNGRSGVFQYDFGKDIQGQNFQRTGVLGQPPERLCGAVVGLQARYRREGHRIEEAIDDILHHNPNLRSHYTRPSSDDDKLYKSSFVHLQDGGEPCAAVCEYGPSNCVERPARAGNKPVVHYGVIASANQVMKNAETRDKLAAEDHVLCFEMEAAGLMKNFPCLVIRGICDYSDTHKNKQWQGYAAMTAAAYAKDLLNELSPLCCASPAATSTELWNSTTEFHRKDQIDERRQQILESLSFSQIDARKLTIKNAHADSCKWVLNSSEYRDWLDPTKREAHDGFFWIKGKPGAGKSTLMKFISTWHRKETPRDTIITFFFNARGEELEKSTIGMYRSLLFQLIDGLPQLRTILDFPDLMAPNTGPREWTIDLLKIAFEKAVLKLENSSVTCFVNALDECDEDQIREMVSFFKQMSEETTSTRVSFQVCFSSRHYPQINISKAVNLVLETKQGHEDDIVKYISSKLKIGKGKIAQEVRHDLQKKASGVFMWVVLVVDILIKECDRGRIHELRKRLKELPSDLDKLFREILTRDHHNRDRLLLCLQWVLFAKEPLRPEQLYFAILSGIEDESTEALSDWDPEDITTDIMERFIIGSSKGLTEVTKAKEPKVQFIHESARDFLLKHHGLSQICGDLRGNIEGQCHDRLKHCCLKYLSVAAAMEIDQAFSPASSDEATMFRRSTEERLPFLRYATKQIFYHADTAEGLGVSQSGFLHTFDLPEWIALDNLLEKHKYADTLPTPVSCIF